MTNGRRRRTNRALPDFMRKDAPALRRVPWLRDCLRAPEDIEEQVKGLALSLVREFLGPALFARWRGDLEQGAAKIGARFQLLFSAVVRVSEPSRRWRVGDFIDVLVLMKVYEFIAEMRGLERAPDAVPFCEQLLHERDAKRTELLRPLARLMPPRGTGRPPADTTMDTLALVIAMTTGPEAPIDVVTNGVAEIAHALFHRDQELARERAAVAVTRIRRDAIRAGRQLAKSATLHRRADGHDLVVRAVDSAGTVVEKPTGTLDHEEAARKLKYLRSSWVRGRNL